jgi:hypothetical protein
LSRRALGRQINVLDILPVPFQSQHRMTDHTVTLAAGTTTHFPSVGHTEPALLKILRAVVVSNPTLLDRPLLLGTDHDGFLGNLSVATENVYLDVPLRAIHATQHKLFGYAPTWRAALACLTGEDKSHRKWDDRALAYFESEIGEQPFPCDAASSAPLDLEAWGGAVFCANGAQRLIASMGWIAAHKGEAGELRKVRVTHYRLNGEAVGLMAEAARRKAEIRCGRVGGTWLLAIHSRSGLSFLARPKTWLVENGTLASATAAQVDDRFGRGTLDSLQVLPPELAVAVADDGWLKRQLDLKPRRYESRLNSSRSE